MTRWHSLAASTIAVIATLVGATTAGAGAPEPSDDSARELAERFAPIVMIKQQEQTCDPDGEPYAPAAVDIVLDNPEIALRQVGGGNPTVQRGPGATDLFELGDGFFLDFPGSSLEPGCTYQRDFDKYTESYPPTVYAHVVQQPDVPDRVFVQYWIYWYYNDWNNKHESDWEGITVVFDAGSIDEALRSEPLAVGYSQHEGGERADWDDDKLGREGDRPVVYSSAGSHASYFQDAIYLGRGASEGFGCDDTTGPSERVDPAVVLVPDAVDDPDDPLAWVSYRGRWGERQNGAFNGPTGPAVKDRWLEPAPWFDDLRPSSVVIPAGNTSANEVIDVFCEVVEWGSGQLITFAVSPLRLILSALVVFFALRFLVRRTEWNPVPATPIVRRRRAGQILRTAMVVFRRAPAIYILFGLVYIPAAIVTGLLAAVLLLVPGVSALVALAQGASGTSLVLAAFVGSIANVAAFVIVNAIVAEYLDGPERGFDAAFAALRTTFDRRRALLGAFVRSFAIVFVLLVSFVGIPWGIRQLVRYQFVAQAVAYDDLDGRAALDRSSSLVTGRWLHTALVVALLNGAVALLSLVAGLLILLLATGLPLWAFSAIVSLVSAFTVPIAAIAMTLLYGDAIAEAQHDSDDVSAPDPATVS
ncbi:MAG: hypothetical protein CL424_18675 [Acidimicrobiaceae bacterium]|nr:hypothetical protein [Acidimicrobiaceae bacterium]